MFNSILGLDPLDASMSSCYDNKKCVLGVKITAVENH